MRILVDTQPLLWIAEDDRRLPERVRILYSDPSHDFIFSLASAWEMAIKISLGKLVLSTGLPAFVRRFEGDQGMRVCPVDLSHVLQVERLPFHHRDPFDRLLVAQALVERLPILSGDGAFDAYGVERIW